MKEFKRKEYKQKENKLKTFLVLWSTQSLSQLGSAMTNFALTLWLYQKTGSALQTALLSICSYAPYVLMSIFAGALSDRWDKKKVMLFSDTFAACSTVAVLVLLKTDFLRPAHLYLLNAVNGLMNTIQQPASDVAMTLIIPKDQYQRKVIVVDDNKFMEGVELGEKITASDGEIQFEIINLDKNGIQVIALNSGILLFGKALYKNNYYFKQENINKQIELYREFIYDVQPYGIILSFLESEDDIKIYKKKFPKIKIIPKIETPLGVENIDKITNTASIIMLGRGDLGNISAEKLGYYQDKIFSKCKNKNIELIVATGILNCLSNNQPVIERAEILDGYYLAKNGVDFVVASNSISKNKLLMDRFVEFWDKLYVDI